MGTNKNNNEAVDGKPAWSIPWSKVGFAIAGLGLFLYLVLSSGITLDLLVSVGWAGFALVLAIYAVNFTTGAQAWRLTLRHVARPSLYRMVAARLGGDSLTNGLPGGVVLGESYKAVVLKRWFGVSLTDAAASQLTVKFGLGISQSLFVLAGLVLVYPLLRDRSVEIFGFQGAQYIGVAVIVGFQAVLTLLLLAVFRGRSFGAVARSMTWLPIPPLRRWLASNQERINQVDQSCARVFSDNRRHLPATFALFISGWLLAALESFVLLRALGQPVTLQTAFIIESVGSMFRLLFFLVPSGIGGQDASLMALFRLFRLPRAAGGAFVLIKRFKELVWIGLGFITIMATRQDRRAHTPEPVPVEPVTAATPEAMGECRGT
jgi:uncharacterized protein (TIRG00374 family)